MENKGRYVDYFDEWQRRNKMNYPVLEIFDIVELRDGRLAVALPVSEEPDEKTLGLYSRAYVFTPLISDINKSSDYDCNDYSYNDDLTHSGSSDLDIMKVLKYSKFEETPTFSYGSYMRLVTDIVIRRGICWDDFKTFNIEDRLIPFGWTWEREEFKEVTMDDIEKKFGCKVKIVKEADDDGN